MVTTKKWKEFNEYRDKLYKEVLNSKEYKDILEKQSEILKATFTEKSIWSMYDDIASLVSLNSYIETLFFKIPPKTVEACLDWLNKK